MYNTGNTHTKKTYDTVAKPSRLTSKPVKADFRLPGPKDPSSKRERLPIGNHRQRRHWLTECTPYLRSDSVGAGPGDTEGTSDPKQGQSGAQCHESRPVYTRGRRHGRTSCARGPDTVWTRHSGTTSPRGYVSVLPPKGLTNYGCSLDASLVFFYRRESTTKSTSKNTSRLS